MTYVRNFAKLTMRDIGQVGGKNASLGEMIRQLTGKGITIPPGFAITAQAYWYLLEQNNLIQPLKKILAKLPKRHVEHADLPALAALVSKHESSSIAQCYPKI